MLGGAVFYVVELVLGEADDVSRAVSALGLFLLVGAGLIVLARGLGQGSTWARTPTLVWSILWLPVGISLVQSGQTPWGVAVLVLAVVTVLAVLRLPREPKDGDDIVA